jgi:alkylation response protein AidB-like acyl-CoA dehydrogenase
MAQQIADRRDVDFVLFEQMEADKLARYEKYADFNKKTIDLIITEARNLSIKEILPTNKEGDETGCKLENGQVKVPECFRRPYQLYCEGDWIAATEDPEVGGQGMPVIVAQAAAEYFVGANMSFTMYPGLTHGAAHLVEVFGTEKQKKLYLEKMYKGKWGGTMLLTEPDAGSDVGALTTTATPNGDGTYTIRGQKIFISAGDNDLVENIIHPVLARIEGAPAGTRGISLFAVPKIRVNDDGSLGESNDVYCDRLEEKMGIHGNATCVMILGAQGKCKGTLLGEPNKGMRAMFQMMNEARLGVGIQGYSQGAAAYMAALDYARQRVQGKNLLDFMNPDARNVTLINHPDVRRMLLFQRAYVDGMRSFIYFMGKALDMTRVSESAEERGKWEGIIEVCIPVLKAYCTDKGFEVASMAMQTYGGYGYTKEYPVEQYARDARITSIYEGTNGIQAMDLLGRKLGMKGGKPIMDLLGEINKTIAAAKAVPELAELAADVEGAVNRLDELAMYMGKTAMSGKALTAYSFAKPFLDVTGDVMMAWMHLWRAVIAQGKVGAAKAGDKVYYEGMVKTARYFIKVHLPATVGNMRAIKEMDDCIATMDDALFAAK